MCDEVIFCKMQDEIQIEPNQKGSITFMPYGSGELPAHKQIIIDIETSSLLIKTQNDEWVKFKFEANEIIINLAKDDEEK